MSFKPTAFLGNSLDALRAFPANARRDAVYVLHCFQKKSQKTSAQDLALARARYKDLMKEQRK